MGYDIIGDIHGHADALKALLTDLGYRPKGGAWRHPVRQALFVGDFIDRGRQQLGTVNLVRRMVEAGAAQAVMGNHEFNAIAWFLPDPECPGEHLRKHYSEKHGDKNRRQHEAFLTEVEGKPIHGELIDWFLSLPLFLELPELRLVHACWHLPALDYLRPYLTLDNRLRLETMIPASREPEDDRERDSSTLTIFKAVEMVLKGIEAPLPAPSNFMDKDGHQRDRVRVRWWDSEATDYRRAAMLSADERKALPDCPVPPHVLVGHDGSKPVFFGHYWLSGTPQLLSEKVACVDYSVANGGRLVAYCWDGEPTLDEIKLHWVGKRTRP